MADSWRAIRRLAAGACALALGCWTALPASAQSLGRSLEQVRAGLDRAVRPPLEIIWLQSEIQADMWRTPVLARALQDCTQPGAPREGCAVSVRGAWHYSFDAAGGVRPEPIVISSLDVPGAAFAKGRLNLSGNGRVFLVTSGARGSEALAAAPGGAILLAAGSTVQLVDAAYPSIQIEVKAPQDQPLFLGNLAAAEIGRIFALLLPRGVQSASAADVLQEGTVALRARDTIARVEVASAARIPRMPVALVEERETGTPPPEPQAILVLDTMPVALAEAAAFQAPKRSTGESLLVLDVMPAAVAQRPEKPAETLAEASDILVLDSMPVAVAQPAGQAVRPQAEILIAAAPAPGATPALSPDLARLRAEVEAEIARDNERLAQSLQNRSGRHFRFGT